MRAGVFDSGIGGLTVAKSLIEHRLFEEIIYFGDTARVPYGSKDENTIVRYSLEALEFFKNFDIDILITACNTVSAYALPELRRHAPFDVVGVIEPGVLSLERLKLPKESSIMVLGTKATIRSRSYQEQLAQLGYHNITAMATGLFVPLVEEGVFGGELLEAALNYYFGRQESPQAIILGCTHFPLISHAIANRFPQAALVHSGEAIVEYLKSNYHLREQEKETTLKLFASENPESLKRVAALWLSDKTLEANT
ncbi:MAG: glutamate racemase [Campylobacterales bacterium]